MFMSILLRNVKSLEVSIIYLNFTIYGSMNSYLYLFLIERHTHWTCSNGIADYYECDGVDNKTCSESCKPTIEVEENKCILSTADFNYITVGCSNPFKNLPSSTSSSSSSTSSVSTTSTPAGSSTTTSSGVTLVSVTYILGLCILAVLF